MISVTTERRSSGSRAQDAYPSNPEPAYRSRIIDVRTAWAAHFLPAASSPMRASMDLDIPHVAFHRWGRFMRAISSRRCMNPSRTETTPRSAGSDENLASAGKSTSRYDGLDFHSRSRNVLMSWSS